MNRNDFFDPREPCDAREARPVTLPADAPLEHPPGLIDVTEDTLGAREHVAAVNAFKAALRSH